MKKNYIKLLLLVFLLIPLKILASGDITVSPTSISVEEGSSKTITITASNTIGDVTIKSSNTKIASVNTNEWQTGAVDANKKVTGKVTVKGLSVGKTTIVFTLDAATFDGEDLSGKTRSVEVNVTKKATTSTTPTTPSSKTNKKSTNNKLKEISVTGYKLIKVNNNNYTLKVNNNISSIDLKVSAEDSKAKVSGSGKHNLKIGSNKIEVVITSESGSKNKIAVTVIREEKTFKDMLSDSETRNIDISLLNYGLLSKEDLEIIKDANNNISFDFKDENGKLLYSWIINGSEIKEYNEFVTTVKFNSEYRDEILKLTNNASGKFISFTHDDKLPEGTKLKVFVGDYLNDNSESYIYSYTSDNNKLELIREKIIVKNGYVEFDISKCNDLFITSTKTETKSGIMSLISDYKTVLSIVIIVFIVWLMSKIFNKKN